MLGYVWAGLIIVSVLSALLLGNTETLSAALIESGSASIELLLTMAGILCLWSGFMKIGEESGLTALISRLFAPLLRPLFPKLDKKSEAFQSITMNISANLLGLGNAATPMGIRAAGRLRDSGNPIRATDGLCRLVVMNTASIQLLPTTVAAVRQSAGCASPFDILPCVWVSSILSVSAGLVAAKLLGRVWRG